MKFERIKVVGKDGVVYSKPIGDVEIYLEDGQILLFKDVVENVLQLQKDLITKERDLKASQQEIQNQLVRLKNVELAEIQIVNVSNSLRLKKLEDETDII